MTEKLNPYIRLGLKNMSSEGFLKSVNEDIKEQQREAVKEVARACVENIYEQFDHIDALTANRGLGRHYRAYNNRFSKYPVIRVHYKKDGLVAAVEVSDENEIGRRYNILSSGREARIVQGKRVRFPYLDGGATQPGDDIVTIRSEIDYADTAQFVRPDHIHIHWVTKQRGERLPGFYARKFLQYAMQKALRETKSGVKGAVVRRGGA
jgi:hypothetical protein